jgi:hypothetical protein
LRRVRLRGFIRERAPSISAHVKTNNTGRTAMLARTFSAFVVAVGLAALPVHAQDKAKAAPAKADAKEIASESKVLFENDKARVNYFLSDAKMQRTSKDGKTVTADRKQGTAVWLDADQDVVKNIGNTTLVGISVVHK